MITYQTTDYNNIATGKAQYVNTTFCCIGVVHIAQTNILK